MTKQTTWDGKEVLLCEVPEDGYDFSIVNPTSRNKPLLDYNKKGSTANYQTLPSGSYRFAFIDPLKPTKKEVMKWVKYLRPFVSNLYMNYESGFYDVNTGSIASLHSRIKAEGFDNPERVIVLIKNK